MKRYAWIAALVFALDRAAKLAAERMAGPVELWPGVLRLRCVRNTGMAFSLLSGRSALLGVLSVALIAGGLLLLRRYRLGPLSRAGAMLALGGALGNLADRLLLGYVTDMVEITLFRFAVFNLADAALTVGMILLGISILFRPQEWERI